MSAEGVSVTSGDIVLCVELLPRMSQVGVTIKGVLLADVITNMLKHILLVALVVLSCNKIPKGIVNTPAPKQQGSHFFSQTEKTKEFTLNDLDVHKYLLLILRPKSDINDINFELDNSFKFELNDNHKVTKECSMTKMNSLCVIPKVSATGPATLKVTCSQLPCEFGFEALQLPEPHTSNKNESLQYLYNLNSSDPTLTVISTDPKISDLGNKVRVYTNGQYEVSTKDNNILYYDFDGHVDYVLVYPNSTIERSIKVRVEEEMKEAGFDQEYRLTINKTKEIKIAKIPSKELRVDATLSELNSKPLNKINFTFIGYTTSSDSNPIEIETFTIDQMDEEGLLDINLILKKNAFTNINHFSMKVISDQNILLSFQLVDSNLHQLDVEEESYISLDKDETVEYKIIASPDSDADEKIEVQILDKAQESKLDVKLSEKPCYYKKGCTMKVTAKEAVVAGLGIVLERFVKNEVKYIRIKNSLSLQVAEGEIKYLIHNETSVKSKKVTVNTNNVLVYIGGEKCPHPSAKCSDHIGSLQKPILIQNPFYPMYIAVEGLELSRFTLRIDETDAMINLEDGVALTQSITKEEGLYFRFKIKSKEAVNFNLIAPLNTFQMYISNSNEKPDVEDVNLQMSTNYFKYEQDEIDELIFTILVNKVANTSENTFTIIASTSSAILVLGKGEPHYDIISNEQTKTYVVLFHADEMEDDLDTHIGFSIFQTLDQPNFSYSVGIDSKDLKNETKITRRTDLINLEEFADDMCDFTDKDVCDLYFSITNHNKQQVDVTLTVLTNDTVIELKTGIWQSYEMASVTATNHFYFTPNNKKYPIVLQFAHTYGSFKISYLLWKNEQQVNDAAQWPFPTDSSSSVAVKAAFQTSDYVIHADQIAKCFPNCILLVSLIDTDPPEKSSDPNVVAPIFSRFGTYSIMVSNSIMEMRELEKMSITLAKEESKYLLIDLNSFLNNGSNVITVYTTNIVGYTSVIAKLSSNRDPTYPTDTDNDYRIFGPELQIKISDIKEKLESSKMDEHEEIHLIFLLKAISHARIVISFTSKENYIQHLNINTPQEVHLAATSVKFYSVEYYQDYKLKIVRISGFPALAYRICNSAKMEECIDSIESDSGSMINSKVDQIAVKYCASCVLIVKLIAKQDPVNLEITAVGGNEMTELREGITINDFVNKGETSRYKINVVKEQETIVTITVFEGNPSVSIKNVDEGIDVKGTKKGNLIQLHIPSSAFKKALTNNTNSTKPTSPTVLFSNMALSSVFSELIVEVTDSAYNCSYSVSYTLGDRSLYIQDGILTSGVLRPSESIEYSYHNSRNSTAFVSISFQDAHGLEKCEVQYASFTQNEDEEPVLKTPAKLQVKTRTPKPSITFQLQEQYSDFEIKLTNKDTKEIPFNITINHVDIVLLPYGYKYPTMISKGEGAYFVVEVFNEGYIQFDIKKCTETPITFSYALDDQSFEEEAYTYSSQIEDNRFSSFVHVKASTIFLKVEAEDPSLFSIEANWYGEKKAIPNNKIKPGDSGILDYYITGEKQATVTFSPLVCPDCKDVTYEYILGKSHNDVLTQTACEGNFFLFAPIQTLKPQVVKPKPSKTESGKLTFDIKLPEELTYLGLKALLKDGREVFYSVIEVSTVWGSIQKNKNYHLGLLAFGVFMFGFCCYMYRRRPEKRKGGKGYHNLPQQFDP